MSKVHSPYNPRTSARHNESRKLYRHIHGIERLCRRILERNGEKKEGN